MSTLQQLREGLHGAWETLVDDWQRLSRRASSALTRFTPGKKTGDDERDHAGQDLAIRSAGWGVLVDMDAARASYRNGVLRIEVAQGSVLSTQSNLDRGEVTLVAKLNLQVRAQCHPIRSAGSSTELFTAWTREDRPGWRYRNYPD